MRVYDILIKHNDNRILKEEQTIALREFHSTYEIKCDGHLYLNTTSILENPKFGKLIGEYLDEGDLIVLEDVYSLFRNLEEFRLLLYTLREKQIRFVNLSTFYIDGAFVEEIEEFYDNLINCTNLCINYFNCLRCVLSGNVPKFAHVRNKIAEELPFGIDRLLMQVLAKNVQAIFNEVDLKGDLLDSWDILKSCIDESLVRSDIYTFYPEFLSIKFDITAKDINNYAKIARNYGFKDTYEKHNLRENMLEFYKEEVPNEEITFEQFVLRRTLMEEMF